MQKCQEKADNNNQQDDEKLVLKKKVEAMHKVLHIDKGEFSKEVDANRQELKLMADLEVQKDRIRTLSYRIQNITEKAPTEGELEYADYKLLKVLQRQMNEELGIKMNIQKQIKQFRKQLQM